MYPFVWASFFGTFLPFPLTLRIVRSRFLFPLDPAWYVGIPVVDVLSILCNFRLCPLKIANLRLVPVFNEWLGNRLMVGFPTEGRRTNFITPITLRPLVTLFRMFRDFRPAWWGWQQLLIGWARRAWNREGGRTPSTIGSTPRA